MKKVLFACKNNERFKRNTKTSVNSGLFNGCQMVVNALNTEQIAAAKIINCVGERDLIAEIEKFKPDVVVVQALWFNPAMLEGLSKFSNTKFICHIHSNIPFLALESEAMHYLCAYKKHDWDIVINSVEGANYFRTVFGEGIYLPNVYSKPICLRSITEKEDLHIGCFGAIRPMKNHLSQAIAAIEFAKQKGKPLFFHINNLRIEAMGNGVYHNLMHLFLNQPEEFQLVHDGWIEPAEFPSHLMSMDLCMQLSMTETFNIVTADAISVGSPVVVSKDIDWVDSEAICKTNKLGDILEVMETAYLNEVLAARNAEKLRLHNKIALEPWKDYISAL